ncbi:acid-resistance membrane protein [Candidatus Rubidus massiliensis]|nr:MAG: hypothetical protein BGO10_06225 [Chlamydia sp. 32-24]CDZ81695.1 acid-resistance membrane protein [Candidatus Rubidus massiliensis]
MFETLQRHKSFYIFESILFIILGMLAIGLPMLFTFATTIFIGWILIAAGIWQIVSVLKTKHSWEFFWFLINSIVTIIAGGLLIFYPVLGAVTLTALLIAYFLISGIAKIIIGFRSKNLQGWGWLIASGVISILLSFLIWQGWPDSALWVIGLFVGIDLLIFGVSLLTLVLSAPKNNNIN